MTKKFLAIPLILILLFCSGCAGVSPAPTEIIRMMDDPYVLRVDLPGLVNDSDTVVLARVEETFPAEQKYDDYVITPANIKVIQSLKGNYKPGDIFRIDQPGGVAGGVDFRLNTMYFHKDGETYFFFIGDFGSILDSEHVINGKVTDEGYFLDGKTADEAVSIINECIKTLKTDLL